ncbi:MAG: hypothetical protein AAFQ22_12470 [Pseudomonadota bacterium]
MASDGDRTMDEHLTAAPDASRRTSSYAQSGGYKIKRLWLGAFLGAVTAVLAVAFVALVFATVGWAIGETVFGSGAFDSSLDGNPLAVGAVGALFACLFNWYVFFISIPIATLVLRFSLGRLPGKGVSRTVPYLRWGAIWGAILVSLPCLIGGTLFSGLGGNGLRAEPDGFMTQVFVGAGLTGLLVGAIAGVCVAGMFMLIVRPKSQVKLADPASAF